MPLEQQGSKVPGPETPTSLLTWIGPRRNSYSALLKSLAPSQVSDIVAAPALVAATQPKAIAATVRKAFIRNVMINGL
ncbi:hypothetical protein ACWAT4_21295 [Bradyrhizobium manausense]